VDNPVTARIDTGAHQLGVPLGGDGVRALSEFAELLARWNTKVNLTGAHTALQVASDHILDSLALVPLLVDAEDLLDLGAGAGFPGLPLSVAIPSLRACLVDSVAKKVAFMKSAIAALGLAPRVRALHARASGDPAAEGLSRAQRVVSRALMEPARFLPLAARYLAPTGRVLCMLGKAPSEQDLEALAAAAGLQLVELRPYRLPDSPAARAVAVFRPVASGG
jgi:16S rRNA (guanine527-N7)-methyltransferase